MRDFFEPLLIVVGAVLAIGLFVGLIAGDNYVAQEQAHRHRMDAIKAGCSVVGTSIACPCLEGRQ